MTVVMSQRVISKEIVELVRWLNRRVIVDVTITVAVKLENTVQRVIGMSLLEAVALKISC